MLEAPKEMYELVADKLGLRWAMVALWAVVAGLICGSLTIVGIFLRSLSQSVVTPALGMVPALPEGSVATAITSLIISGVIITVAVYFLLARTKKWEQHVFKRLGAFLDERFGQFEQRLAQIEDGIVKRIDSLEHGTVTFKSARQACDELESRLKEIEPKPLELDYTGIPQPTLAAMMSGFRASAKLRTPATIPGPFDN